MQQAKHVMKALMVVEKSYRTNQPITWRDVCRISCKKLMSNVTGRTVEIWAMDYQNNGFFTVAKVGRKKIELEFNPFTKESGNADLHQKIKHWSNENLEGMTVKKMNINMTELLTQVMKQEPLFKMNFGFKFPLSNHTVANWMKGIGFLYRPQHFAEELNEACLIQVSDQDLRHQMLQAYGNTGEKDKVLNNLIARCEHTFNASNPFGGYLSIRRNLNSKTYLVFGQDESVFVLHSLNKII